MKSIRTNRFTVLPAIGVLVLVSGFTLLLFWQSVGNLETTNKNQDEQYSIGNDPLITRVHRNSAPTEPQPRQQEIIYGNPEAPITVYEYSDFACPYCGIMASQLRELIDTNKDLVKLVWRDFPIASLHQGATEAHVAARCANEQGKFWEYHDLLFSGSKLIDATYSAYAKDLDLSVRQFNSCRKNPTIRLAVTADIQEGNDLLIDGTPYLFVNDQRISGLVTLEELQQVIDFHKLAAGIEY